MIALFAFLPLLSKAAAALVLAVIFGVMAWLAWEPLMILLGFVLVVGVLAAVVVWAFRTLGL